jgi:DNA (cytosine-5)-methyltransferase 1
MHAPKLVDLFCGCGGISLGAARAGFDVAVAIDHDPRALAAHQLNFPNARHGQLDLAKASAEDILTLGKLQGGEIDLVAGGPPCQGFSIIGKRAFADERNSLICDFLRLVSGLNPKVFVMENVPGVLDPQFASVLCSALAFVKPEYALLQPRRIKACDVGAPTVRTRVIIVGFRSDSIALSDRFLSMDKEATSAAPFVRDALSGLPFNVRPPGPRRQSGRRVVHVDKEGFFFDSATDRVPARVGCPEALEEYFEKSIVTGCIGVNHSQDLIDRYDALAYGETDPKTKSTRLDPNGYCPTLRAGTGPERGSFQAVRPIHYLKPRVITPREAARLQGFPDWFQFDATKWHSFRQLGNSVSPLVAEAVFQPLAKVLMNAY